MIHAALRAVVVVGALGRGGKLSLTHLGRDAPSDAFARHNFKRFDQPLGNRPLRREWADIYRALVRWLLVAARPIILVDWADCTPRRTTASGG